MLISKISRRKTDERPSRRDFALLRYLTLQNSCKWKERNKICNNQLLIREKRNDCNNLISKKEKHKNHQIIVMKF